MSAPTITVEMGLSEAAVMATALSALVTELNEALAEVIAMEGEGTGRTFEALDLKFTAILMMQGLLTACGMPPEQVADAVRDLSEGGM